MSGRRYTPTVARPDLVERAGAELGLGDARAYRLDGRWYVQGRNGRGMWRLFAAVGDGWAEVTSAEESYEQGRLL